MAPTTSLVQAYLKVGENIWVVVGRSNHVATVQKITNSSALVKLWNRGDVQEVDIIGAIKLMDGKRTRKQTELYNGEH
jgi:sRNA-binding protein